MFKIIVTILVLVCKSFCVTLYIFMVTQIKLVVVVVVDNATYFLLLGSVMKKNEILLLLLGLAQGNKEFVWEAPILKLNFEAV